MSESRADSDVQMTNGLPVSAFVLTLKGKRIHIADAGESLTRCGWIPTSYADAEDVLWFGVCASCYPPDKDSERAAGSLLDAEAR